MRSVTLVANYSRDEQQSMARFADLLARGLRAERVDVCVWQPPAVFGKLLNSTQRGYRKWLGYLDKWVVAFVILKLLAILQRNRHYHICDHSNAPYLAVLPRGRKSITCHDVLAIRGALGQEDAYCTATRLGKVLQRCIRHSLTGAPVLAAVSDETMRQLLEVVNYDLTPARWCVIPNALNAEFRMLPASEAEATLRRFKLSTSARFVLHVGSDLQRKNRSLLLYACKQLKGSWDGNVCFAGAALTPEMWTIASNLGVADRVVEIVRPDHDTLLALYSHCFAFAFPSLSEGFGWPVIEAQACGAPVVLSHVAPMPEVSGGAALFADPTDPSDFAAQLLRLEDTSERQRLIEAGLKNAARFSTDTMCRGYIRMMGI